MRHCDDATLAAIALGDPVDASDAAHVAACERCAREVDALRALQATLVDAGSSSPLVAAPDALWSAIEAEVAAGDDAAPARTVPLTSARGVRRRREPDHMFRPWVVGAAAAAGVAIGAFGVSLLARDGAPSEVLVAQASLADLATEAPAGTARVEQRDDGSEVLVVDTTYVATQAGSLEVWLIDPEVVGMVSVGFLTGDHGEFEIPPGYDVASFPIVDISIEPADGDPTHSGDSITRGVLEG
ncbi:anti-sigma factor domain-containing protein [Demequina gelatinilytica]|uniref:anti-sigma factor domain-containing protein n=1 Tax=Demequina gelatinilytica TaxID=1638980 RepID=UPI000784FF3D|nr:anti-sigma factor [Demequina gelatinilytica]